MIAVALTKFDIYDSIPSPSQERVAIDFATLFLCLCFCAHVFLFGLMGLASLTVGSAHPSSEEQDEAKRHHNHPAN